MRSFLNRWDIFNTAQYRQYASPPPISGRKSLMPTTYLALGSNLSDREANLRRALQLLEHFAITIIKLSSFYETEPVDYLDQPWFLNAALEAQTDLPPTQLLSTLRGIESHMGNHKPIPKGPRLIDLDILLYNDLVIDEPTLQIPHPRMRQRNFVLVPLAEIAPHLRHPTWPANIADTLANSPDRSAVRRFSPSKENPLSS